MAVAIALFIGGVVMGVAGAFMWAWAVRTGQFRDLERSKHQLFWPDIAETDATPAKPTANLAQEQGERANAELHAELERTTYGALDAVKAWGGLTHAEFSALCFLCGFKVSDFNGKGKQ